MSEIVTTRKKLKSGWNNFVFGIANDLRNELVTTCPVDTGNLKNSIRVEPDGKGYNIFMPEYFLYLEYGTPPHIIRPKNKKALHWGGKSGPIVKLVHHPGTRPQPFIRPVLNTKLKSIVKDNAMRHLQ